MNEELVFILNQINTSKLANGGCFKGLGNTEIEECSWITCSNCICHTGANNKSYIRKILTLPLNFK